MVSTVCGMVMVLVSALELNEAPATADEWGYRPSAELPATMNPPAFVWRGQKEADFYGLQVASDTAFKALVYSIDETTLSSHCPPTTFKPGTYFWRYRAGDNAGTLTPWSQIRSFTVTEGLTTFPKPSIDELRTRISKSHPKLMFRPDDIALLQEKSSGDLKKEWKALVDRADKLLASPPPSSEPPKYPQGTVVKSKEWKTIWWGNRRYSIALTDGAATLGFVYQITGDRKYGDAARDLLLAFAEWDPKGSTNYSYNDEAAMPLLYYPARTYSWIHDILTPEERNKVRSVMKVRAEDCYNHLRKRQHLWRPYASHSNRAWHFLGEVAIAFQGEIPEAQDWLEYSMTIFYSCYPVWGGADGAWHEGTAYWSSYLTRFMYWVVASQSAFNIDPFHKPFFAETGYYGLYTVPPGTKTGAWGDQTPHTSSTKVASFMKTLGLGAGNPHWVWYGDIQNAGAPSGYIGFLLAARAGDLLPKAPSDIRTSKVFPDTGVATFNTNLVDGSDNVQVQFKSSRFGRKSHGYNANNAFLLNINGERVFIRSGRRDVYGSPHHKKWMWETKSDNAITVNNIGQLIHTSEAQGRISNYRLSDEIDMVEGEAGLAYGDNLSRWTRRMYFIKPYALIIHDFLEAPSPSTYQWYLHAQSEFILSEDSARFEKTEDIVAEVQFLEPAGLRLSQKGEYDTPTHDWYTVNPQEWHLKAETTKKSKQQEFISIIKIGPEKINASLTRENGIPQVSIERENLTLTIDLQSNPNAYPRDNIE